MTKHNKPPTHSTNPSLQLAEQFKNIIHQIENFHLEEPIRELSISIQPDDIPDTDNKVELEVKILEYGSDEFCIKLTRLEEFIKEFIFRKPSDSDHFENLDMTTCLFSCWSAQFQKLIIQILNLYLFNIRSLSAINTYDPTK